MNIGLSLSFDITGVQALPANGCSQYKHMLTSWQYLFLYGFILGSSGSGSYRSTNFTSFQSCKVMPGSSMYYDDLGRRWKTILKEIFTVRFGYNEVFLEVRWYIQSCLNGRDHDKIKWPWVFCFNVICTWSATSVSNSYKQHISKLIHVNFKL